jgi:transcription initiation factor IIE alpha subunit
MAKAQIKGRFGSLDYLLLEVVEHRSRMEVLALVQRLGKKKGKAFMSQKNMAEQLRMSERTVRYALSFLQQKGFISIQQNHNLPGNRKCYVYQGAVVEKTLEVLQAEREMVEKNKELERLKEESEPATSACLNRQRVPVRNGNDCRFFKKEDIQGTLQGTLQGSEALEKKSAVDSADASPPGDCLVGFAPETGEVFGDVNGFVEKLVEEAYSNLSFRHSGSVHMFSRYSIVSVMRLLFYEQIDFYRSIPRFQTGEISEELSIGILQWFRRRFTDNSREWWLYDLVYMSAVRHFALQGHWHRELEARAANKRWLVLCINLANTVAENRVSLDEYFNWYQSRHEENPEEWGLTQRAVLGAQAVDAFNTYACLHLS